MGRVLIVGDASGKLHRLDANGFAVLGGAEMRQRAAQVSAQASQGAQKGLVRKSLGALGGFASSVVGLLGDEEDPAGYDIDDGAVTALSATEEGDVFAFLATGACQRWRLGATASFVCAHEACFADESTSFAGFFSPPPTGTVKKPWVCHAAACVGNTIVAAQHAGELSRIVILSYHDDGELRRPCFLEGSPR